MQTIEKIQALFVDPDEPSEVILFLYRPQAYSRLIQKSMSLKYKPLPSSLELSDTKVYAP